MSEEAKDAKEPNKDVASEGIAKASEEKEENRGKDAENAPNSAERPEPSPSPAPAEAPKEEPGGAEGLQLEDLAEDAVERGEGDEDGETDWDDIKNAGLDSVIQGQTPEGNVLMMDGTILKPDELTEEDIRNLEKKRDKLNAKAEDHKFRRDKLNDQTKSLIREREGVNNQIRKFVKEANDCKEERNKLNIQVQEAKVLREELNRRANDLNEQVNKLKKERLPKDDGPPISKMKKELRDMEFKHQTSNMSVSAERDFVDKMKKMSEQIKERESKLEANDDVKNAVKDSRKARQDAEAQHALVGTLAESAQRQHDRMVELYSKSDELRKELNKIHESLVDTKAKADEEHKMHIALIRQVHDYDKLIFGMRRKLRRVKKAKGDTDVKKQQKEILDKFKKGQKLSTEDLLALQNK
jgi:uncharacterized coiled-coil DUF342 family protein